MIEVNLHPIEVVNTCSLECVISEGEGRGRGGGSHMHGSVENSLSSPTLANCNYVLKFVLIIAKKKKLIFF